MRSLLRGRQLGVKFRHPHTVAGFVVDFYAAGLALSVEVDGSVHELKKDADAERTRILGSYGVRVMRVSNEMVLNHPEAAVATIREAVLQRQLERGVFDAGEDDWS